VTTSRRASSAARAAGLWPIIMDPYGFQPDADYARVASLAEVAEMGEDGQHGP